MNFITNWCPDGETIDSNGYCKTCQEVLDGCTTCYRGQCLECRAEVDTALDASGYHFYQPAQQKHRFMDRSSATSSIADTDQEMEPEVFRRTCALPDCLITEKYDVTRCAACLNLGFDDRVLWFT